MNAAGTRGTRTRETPLSIVHSFVWSSPDLHDAVSVKRAGPTDKFFTSLGKHVFGINLMAPHVLVVFEREAKHGLLKSSLLAAITIGKRTQLVVSIVTRSS